MPCIYFIFIERNPEQIMKRFFSFLLVFFYLSFMHAQAPAIEWQRSFGGLEWDASRQVRPMPDGTYIVTAYSESFDGDVIGNHGQDWWIYQIDSTGNILQQRCFGGSSWEEPYDLHPTPDDGFIIVGESQSTDFDATENNGERDYWLVKTDASFNIIWQQKYGGSLREIPYGVEFTSDGGYIICGKSFSNDGDVSGHHGSDEFYDIWIVKTDSLGNIQWQKSYGGSDEEIARDIASTPDGGYLIFGWAGSADGDVIGVHGDRDYWLFKIDSVGNMEWQNCYGGSDDDFGWAMTIDSIDQSMMLAGYSRSNDGDVSGNNGGFSDAWTLKINSTGEILWQVCFGGSDRDFSRYIAQTSDGGALISAYACSSDGDVTVHYGEDYQADYWLVKIDNNGVMQWQKTLGGGDNDECYGLSETADSGFIITGWSVNDNIDLTFNHGFRDVWIVKLEKPCLQNKFFLDADTDGYGNEFNYTYSCELLLDGYVLNSSDCNDDDAAMHPDLIDECNAIDDNCNALVDEDAIFETWYEDTDDDNYGSVMSTYISCFGSPIAGFISDSTDCDDANEFIHPGALEICNNLDDNCNGSADEGIIFNIYYADGDGDLFGDAESDSLSCIEIIGYTINSTDCDDSNPFIFPGATELCNHVDDDCDGVEDNGLVYNWWYLDNDGDNFGNAAIDSFACLDPSAYISDSTDCDDTNEFIYPGAPEILNGLDDNCDHFTDEGLNISDLSQQLFNIYPNPASTVLNIDHFGDEPA